MRAGFAYVFLATALLRADGTIDLTQVVQALQPTNPVLMRTILDTYDLGKDVTATVIGQNVNARLGGQRIGPYTVSALTRGKQTPLTIVLKTDIVFLDERGKPTENVASAKSVKESLTSFEVSLKKP